MRVSLNWLKKLVDIDLTTEELGKLLTIAGFEVEAIEDLSKQADGVVIGKVLKRDRHPNADKLSVCTVDIGAETPLNIVCGAPNVCENIFVPVATVGTYLPAVDLKLKPTKLRGVPSVGMICSLSELGLEKDSAGIHIFTDDLTPGADVRPLLGLDDVILDLATTANRADALSMVGIAREVAALTDKEVRLPIASDVTVSSSDSLSLAISKRSAAPSGRAAQARAADQLACPAYLGTVVEDLKIAPSPDWLQWRLQAAGVRPINNVVDITNYILLEWGQPLHAFDRERLQVIAGGENLTIGVRFATEGESLKTLDGQERTLTTQNLVITANDIPVALAGVMGGEATEVYEQTENIILEAALFDPVAVRRSSRAQGLRSEASTRYERGVNQVELVMACNRAIALFAELAAGKAVNQTIADYRPDISKKPAILLRLSRIHSLLGQVVKGETTGNIEATEVETILTALGCQLETIVDQPNTWKVKVPPYRYRDLEREIDLIEEVARLYGYDRFCDTLPDKTEPGYLSVEYQTRNKIRASFRGAGLTELVQYSLVKPTEVEITLANPLFAEYSALRTNLISGLIDAYAYNQSQGNGGLNGFEIGHVFWKDGDDFQEGDRVAGILGGDFLVEGSWTRSGKPAPMSWYEAKGILDGVFSVLGINISYRPDSEYNRFHPGRTASLWLEGKRLGIFGQLHPQLCQEKDLADAVYVFELAFENLHNALNRDQVTTPRFKSYSTYPGSQRDLAFFAPLDLSVTEISKIMTKAGGKLLDKVELFDEYKGKGVPEGQRSLAFNLVYKASDRTLTDQDVDPVHQKVRDTLVKKFDVSLRS